MEPADTRAPLEQRRIVATQIPGPKSTQLHEKRTHSVARGLGTVLPVFLDRADGAILLDVDGNQIIDLASGIAVTSLGHNHPALTKAVRDQAEKFLHTCYMVTEYPGYSDVCERLNAIAPGDSDKRSALFTTGAEALENAVKISRAYTGRTDIVVFDHAYHGRTLFTLGMTSKEAPYKAGFGPFPAHIHRAPLAYPLRWEGGRDKCTEEALTAFEDLLERVGPQNVAAAVIESIQGEGGFIVPPEGFFAGIREITARHGILLVADEVQSGMGRTGTMLAIEHDDVVPDLICTAKALAGGMPLSAVTGPAQVMDVVGPGGLGGTYAGSPLSCAAALAVFDELEKDDELLGSAARIEAAVRRHLEPLVSGSDGNGIVAEVRGRGAMMAIEICKPGTIDADPEATKAIAAACHAQGVLVLTCGTYNNVLRLLPPLVIGDELLDDGLSILAGAIRSVAEADGA
ncbi:MAG: 4-aminobutyrate--2-oxoglutarate transaminase [Micrococcales bacterium]|nr:4-aminobutyrate--2-oxoglutarate transaminase [Micrococcales bacterium]